jgi:hypothetical protein
MKIRSIISSLAIFFAGFSLAWIVKKPIPLGKADQPIVKISQQRASQIQHTSAIDTAKNAHTNDWLKKFEDTGYDSDKKAAVLSQIQTADLLFLIEAISQNAGITGLDYSEREKLDAFLNEWLERDADAAIAWADALKNPKDRMGFLHKIIDNIAKNDLEKAITLAKQYCRDDQGDWSLPINLEVKILSQDAEQMLKSVAMFVNSRGGSRLGVNFPPNYDFRRALDGLNTLQSALKEGDFAFIPGGLVRDWAKSDPEAAWNWLSEGKNASVKGYDDFLQGYSDMASASEVSQMFVKVADRFERPDQYYDAVWRVLAKEQNPELMQQFLARSPENRQEIVNQFFNNSRNSSGSLYDVGKSLLISQMSAAERVSAFTQNADRSYTEPEIEFFTPLLKRLGHDDAEIQKMLPLQEVK